VGREVRAALLEGYGATGDGPGHRHQHADALPRRTVGRLLPGIDHRIEKVAGIDAGGRLAVAGRTSCWAICAPSAPAPRAARGRLVRHRRHRRDRRRRLRHHRRPGKRFAKIAGE